MEPNPARQWLGFSPSPGVCAADAIGLAPRASRYWWGDCHIRNSSTGTAIASASSRLRPRRIAPRWSSPVWSVGSLRQAGAVNVTAPVDWATLRQRIERSARSQTWRDVGCWALDSVRRQLGEDWPTTHLERGLPLPTELVDAGSNMEAFSHLLEFGLRLELLQDVAGFGRIRRTLKTDIRDQARRHALIQLEVASLASRAGLRVQLERSGSELGGPADVVVGTEGSEVVAEVRVVLPDQITAAGAQYDHEVGRVLTRLTMTHDVVFDGQMTARLEETQRSEWFSQLEAAAERVAATGEPQVVAWESETVTVRPMTSGTGSSFTGPVTRAKGWIRTSGLLQGKATQLAAQGGGWLRVDSLDGLFWASAWAPKPLARRTDEISALIHDSVQQHSSIYGVVLTSGSCWAPRLVGRSCCTASGSYGLERPLPLARGRATFIVPLQENARIGTTLWRDLYNDEAAWLDWALGQAGLPSTGKIAS